MGNGVRRRRRQGSTRNNPTGRRPLGGEDDERGRSQDSTPAQRGIDLRGPWPSVPDKQVTGPPDLRWRQLVWLIPQSLRAYPCVPAWPASNSDCGAPSPGCELFVSSSGTPTPRPSSWQGWRTRPWSLRLFGAATSKTWTLPHFSAWILSPPVSPVSPSPSPGSESGSTTRGGSGPPSPGSSTSAVRPSYSWRMSQASFLTEPDPSCVTLPRSGTMRSGICSPRQTWERPTEGSDGSVWPTPCSAEAVGRGQSAKALASGWREMLAVMVKLWPTPRCGPHGTPGSGERHPAWWPTPHAHNAKGRAGNTHTRADLVRATSMWATPCANDWKDGDGWRGPTPTKGNLGLQAPRMPMAGNDGSQPAVLNPAFVEALQGFPPGWTDCAASETPSSPPRPNSPSESSMIGSPSE